MDIFMAKNRVGVDNWLWFPIKENRQIGEDFYPLSTSLPFYHLQILIDSWQIVPKKGHHHFPIRPRSSSYRSLRSVLSCMGYIVRPTPIAHYVLPTIPIRPFRHSNIIKNPLIDGRLLFRSAIIYHLSELMFEIKFYVSAEPRLGKYKYIKNHAQEHSHKISPSELSYIPARPSAD